MESERRRSLKNRSDFIGAQLGTKKSSNTVQQLRSLGANGKRKRNSKKGTSSSSSSGSFSRSSKMMRRYHGNDNEENDVNCEDVDGDDFDWGKQRSNRPNYQSIIPRASSSETQSGDVDNNDGDEEGEERQNRLNLMDVYNNTLREHREINGDEERGDVEEEDDGSGEGYTGSEEDDDFPAHNSSINGGGGGRTNNDDNDCFLCQHFSPDSDNHAIRAMWSYFWNNFWTMGFPYLAKGMYNMYLIEIYYPEVKLRGNERELKRYTWQDFMKHVISPECMGCHPAIALRKLMLATAESMAICENLYRQSYSIHGEGDYRAMEGARRDRKFLLDIYTRNPTDMLGYSDNCESDTSRMGSLARK